MFVLLPEYQSSDYSDLSQIVVDSIRDPKAGVVFDPKSLIQALAGVIGRNASTNLTVVH